jgi:hypothetical protein
MQFPDWVPPDGRVAIEGLAAGDLSAEMRAAIDRLATDDAIRELWDRLSADTAAEVIGLALLAYSFRTPDHPDASFGTPPRVLAICAQTLAEHLRHPTMLKEQWHSLCPENPLLPGEPAAPIELFVLLLLKVAKYYRRAETETISLLRQLNRAPLSRQSGPGQLNARQIHFARTMTGWLRKLAIARTNSIVAALVTAIFPTGPDEAITAETVKNWCRRDRAPG